MVKRNAVISLNHKQKEQTITRTTKWRLSYLVQCYSGSHFTNDFNIIIKIRWRIIYVAMSRQVKLLWGSLCQNLGESKMKFPSNLNCVGNNLSVTSNHNYQSRYTPPPPPPPPPHVLQYFAIPGCFPYILFYRYLFSWLSSGRFVFAVCGSISVRELSKYLELLWTDVELPSPMTSQLNGCHHFVFLFLLIYSFSKLIMTCRLFVIYVREDNYSEL